MLVILNADDERGKQELTQLKNPGAANDILQEASLF